jgi:hypothetical protein
MTEVVNRISSNKTETQTTRLQEGVVTPKRGVVLGTGTGPRVAPPPAIHSRVDLVATNSDAAKPRGSETAEK